MTCDNHPGRLSSPKAMGVHGKEITGDVANYTNIPLQVQISEIVG